MRKEKGLTILELIAVISIFSAIVGMILISGVNKYIEKAKIGRMISELRDIERGIWQYYYDMGTTIDGSTHSWPPGAAIPDGRGIAALFIRQCINSWQDPSAWKGPYISKISPKNPFGGYFTFSCGGTSGTAGYSFQQDVFIPPGGTGPEDQNRVIRVNNVPFNVIQRVDEIVDGFPNGDTGKIRYSSGGTVFFYVIALTEVRDGAKRFLSP